jgi:hypothetical protein
VIDNKATIAAFTWGLTDREGKLRVVTFQTFVAPTVNDCDLCFSTRRRKHTSP